MPPTVMVSASRGFSFALIRQMRKPKSPWDTTRLGTVRLVAGLKKDGQGHANG